MKQMHIMIAAVLMMAAGCNTKDPYPYSPQFAAPVDVPARLLAVPPQPGETLHAQAITDIMKRQRMVDAQTRQAITNEIPVEPRMMVQTVIGPQATPESLPELYYLLERAGSDAHRISDHAKDYWGTKRPYQTDTRVALLIPTISNPSYPSGHTLISYVWAGVLADAAPCLRAKAFTRADEIAQHRIIAGAHYHYDIEAGKQMAALTLRRMRVSDAYAHALPAVKDELAHARVCS